MSVPHATFYARIPQTAADKLDAWMAVHGFSKPKALLYLAAEAKVLTQQELLQALGMSLKTAEAP